MNYLLLFLLLFVFPTLWIAGVFYFLYKLAGDDKRDELLRESRERRPRARSRGR